MDRARQLPAVLLHENRPTVDEIIGQIDPWIFHHLQSTINDLRYENQLYGILNAFLTSVFPLRRRFMIIPQFLLRKALESEQIDDYLANVSFGSTGGLHESRDLPGSESAKLYPDFAIVKVTPQHNPPRDHRLIALVEVKRDNSLQSAANQCIGYLTQAQGHPSRREDLRCYLVSGREISIIAMQAHGPKVVDIFDIYEAGDPFTAELCTIARDEWN